MGLYLLSGEWHTSDGVRWFCGLPVSAHSRDGAVTRAEAYGLIVDTVRETTRMPRMDWASDEARELAEMLS